MWSLAGINNSINNTALGTEAGRFTSNESGPVTSASASIFIGSKSKALDNGQENQIVIGTDATGMGSNTTTIGNLQTSVTYIRGSVTASSFTGNSINVNSINDISVGRGKGGFEENAALGNSCLPANTTGQYNTAIGTNVMNNNLTGSFNTGLGYNNLFFSTISSGNTAIGSQALQYINDGGINQYDNNTALGWRAGYQLKNGSGVTSATSSIFIGANSKPNSFNQRNQIVIGTDTIGMGNNTTTIGNPNTTLTYLYGSVTTDGLSASSIGTTASSYNVNGSSASITTGIILTSPNGSRWKLTVDNSGNLSTVSA
jgi:hypothetical protein